MRFDVEARVTSLTCVQPEEAGDEPYLWTFFAKIDGSTVAQLRGGPLYPSVGIESRPGSHGNLRASGVEGGETIPVPEAVGLFRTSLKPIRLAIRNAQGGEDVVFVPGQVVVIAVLLDQDLTTEAAMEEGREALASLLVIRIHQFILGLNLQEVLAAIRRRVFNGASPEDALREELDWRLGELAEAIEREARGYVETAVLAALLTRINVFDLLGSGIDADDTIGFARFQADQRSLLSAGLTQRQRFTIRRENDRRQWDAVYHVSARFDASISFNPDDLHARAVVLETTVLEQGEQVVGDLAICTTGPGQVLKWTRLSHRERQEYSIDFPVATFEWSIDGRVLQRPGGEIGVTTTCTFPLFDSPGALFPTYRSEPRDVRVRYAFVTVEGVEQLHVFNDPADGNYLLSLQASLPVPNQPAIRAAETAVHFDGQTILCPESERIADCLADLNRRWPRSRRLFPPDLWGPFGRIRFYDEVIRYLHAVAPVVGLARERVRAIERAVADRLGVSAEALPVLRAGRGTEPAHGDDGGGRAEPGAAPDQARMEDSRDP